MSERASHIVALLAVWVILVKVNLGADGKPLHGGGWCNTSVADLFFPRYEGVNFQAACWKSGVVNMTS